MGILVWQWHKMVRPREWIDVTHSELEEILLNLSVFANYLLYHKPSTLKFVRRPLHEHVP